MILLVTVVIEHPPQFIRSRVKTADLHKSIKEFWAGWIYLQSMSDRLPTFGQSKLLMMSLKHLNIIVE